MLPCGGRSATTVGLELAQRALSCRGQEDRQPVPNRLLEEIRMAARLRRTLDEVIRSLPAREEHGAAGYPADVVMTR